MRWSLVVLAGCGAHPAPPAPPTRIDPATVVPGALTGTVGLGEALAVHLAGTAVPLSELPLVDLLGVPMSGAADLRVELDIPGSPGHRDFSRARGTLDVLCTTGCRVGDDRTTLSFAGREDRIDIGHLELDRLELRAVAEQGHAKIGTWRVVSKEIAMELALDVELAPALGDAGVTGCLRWRPLPALEQRNPRLASLLKLTGGALAADGMYNIRLAGTVGAVKLIAQECSVSTSGR